jgi:hypothetical protein
MLDGDFRRDFRKSCERRAPRLAPALARTGVGGAPSEIQVGSRRAPASSNMKCAGSSVWLPYLILPSTFYNHLEQSVMFAF